MPYDYFLSENQARALRWTEHPGALLLKRAMAHIAPRCYPMQWRADLSADVRAYALMAGCAAECIRAEWALK